MNNKKWYHLEITFVLVFNLVLSGYVESYLVERLGREGDKIFNVPKDVCYKYSRKAIWSARYCQCGLRETYYSLKPGLNKCFHGFGKNVGCNLAFSDVQIGVKEFIQDKDYPGQYLGQLTETCQFYTSIIDIWDESSGWRRIDFINAKWGNGVHVSWLQANYTRDIVGKLFRLSFNCSNKGSNCVLFKGLGKELPPPPTTMTTILTLTKQISTTIKTETAISQITITSKQDNSSYILGGLLGVTLFILLAIITVIALYFWFHKKYKEENISILDWIQDRFRRKRSRRQLENGHNDNVYEVVEKKLPPQISARPRPKLNMQSNNLSVMSSQNQAPRVISSRKPFHNKGYQDDNIYLTPVDNLNPQDNTFINKNIHKNAECTPNFSYDSVAHESTSRKSNENYYTITEDEIIESKSITQPIRKDSDIYATLHKQNEELPELPEKYSCLDDVNPTRDEDYCALDVIPSRKNNSNRISCQSEHLYFETEPYT